MAHKIVIRRMTVEDIGLGYVQVLSALYEPNLPLNEIVRIFEGRPDNIITLVAVTATDNEIVGTATLIIEAKYRKEGNVGHIEDVAVRHDFHRRGVGAALVKSLIETASHNRCYKVILNCNEHNRPFYEKLGFRTKSLQMRLDLESTCLTKN